MADVTMGTQSLNGINLKILQSTIDDIKRDRELGRFKFRVHNKWMGATRNLSTNTGFYGAGREMKHPRPFNSKADEPETLAGSGRAPNPAEHLLNSLAECITTSIVAHAAVRGIEIEQLESQLEGDLDLNGFLGLDPSAPKGFTNIRVDVKAKTKDEDFEKLRGLIEYSPVYCTLVNGTLVDLAVHSK